MSRLARRLTPVCIAGLLLAGCGEAVDDSYVIRNDPGHVEEVEGSDIPRVTLTEAAARRLGVQTTVVEKARRGLAVPSTAVIVDPEGVWWVYTNGHGFHYVRHEVEVLRERDGRTVLSRGPAAGTEVVTVGVAELYGVESGVGH
jgi:hypothetical protein